MTETVVGSNGLPSPWNEDRIQILTRKWADGMPASGIAILLGAGISKNSVIGKARRLRLPMRKLGGMFSPRRNRRSHIPRVAVPVAETAAAKAYEFLGIALLDLERGQCRFPHGDDAPYLFCGQPAQSGASYCAHCYAIAHERPPTSHARSGARANYAIRRAA